jgi:hypothetical protein
MSRSWLGRKKEEDETGDEMKEIVKEGRNARERRAEKLVEKSIKEKEWAWAGRKKK